MEILGDQEKLLRYIYGAEDYKKLEREIQSKARAVKSICSKTLYSDDIGWKCLDGELDEYSILCTDGFKHGKTLNFYLFRRP